MRCPVSSTGAEGTRWQTQIAILWLLHLWCVPHPSPDTINTLNFKWDRFLCVYIFMCRYPCVGCPCVLGGQKSTMSVSFNCFSFSTLFFKTLGNPWAGDRQLLAHQWAPGSACFTRIIVVYYYIWLFLGCKNPNSDPYEPMKWFVLGLRWQRSHQGWMQRKLGTGTEVSPSLSTQTQGQRHDFGVSLPGRVLCFRIFAPEAKLMPWNSLAGRRRRRGI